MKTAPFQRTNESSPVGPRGRKLARLRGVDRRTRIGFGVGRIDNDTEKGEIALYPCGGGWAARRAGMVATQVFCTSFDVALAYLGASIDEVTFYDAKGPGITLRAVCAARLVVHERIVRARRAEYEAAQRALGDEETAEEPLRSLQLAQGAMRTLQSTFEQAAR